MKTFGVTTPILMLTAVLLPGLVLSQDYVDKRRHYTGYQVFRIVPEDENQLTALKALAERRDNLDFWIGPSHVNKPVEVMVSPSQIPNLEKFLVERKIPRTILMHDVEKHILKEKQYMQAPLLPTARDDNTFFQNYRRLREIHAYLDVLARKNPNITTMFSAGRSFQKRNMKGIKIGSKGEMPTKTAIWIDGGIHGREWISPATVMYIASRLVEQYDGNDEVRSLVNDFDWYILPVVNPDGYEYSHMVDRLWRKNRRPQLPSLCFGTDLNRNFDFHWNEGGASSDPCNEFYAGPRPFSEPESRALSNFILKINRNKNFLAYLAIHSFAQLWLTTWGYTSELPDDYDELYAVAEEATKALKEVHGTEYGIGSSTNAYGIGSGGADDWAKGRGSIKYSYTVELRDTGRFGVLLPPDQIIPTGEETWAGVKSMSKALKART